MNNKKNDDRLKIVPQNENEQPEVYGMTKGKDGVKLGRQAFLGTLGAGVLASASGCGEQKKRGCEKLRAHRRRIQSLVFSPDGKFLVSADEYGTIKLWGLPEGRFLKTIYKADKIRSTPIVVSPDGKLLISGMKGGNVDLWALPEGTHLKTLGGHSKGVRSIAIGHEGKLLASGSADKTIKLWTLPEGKLLKTLESEVKPLQSVLTEHSWLREAMTTRSSFGHCRRGNS